MRINFLTKYLIIIFLLASVNGYSQNVTADQRYQELIKLDETINKALLETKKKFYKDFPADYHNLWSYNLLKADFAPIKTTQIELYNQFVTIQNQYGKGIEEIDAKFPNEPLESIKKNEIDQKSLMFQKLTKELKNNVGDKIFKQFEQEFSKENFMKTNFEEIPYFVKNKWVLEVIRKLKKKYEPDYNKMTTAFESEKTSLINAEIKNSKERAVFYDKEWARLLKEGLEKEADGFIQNFWLGVKAGANFSSGSSGGKSKAAPGMGIIMEYTLFKIKPIAFESSVEMDINYIQKPVTLPEGVVNTDYINIPVFAKGKWPAHIPLGFGDLTPFIGIGVDPYLRLSSNIHIDSQNKNYAFAAKGFNVGFVWNLGGELNLFGIGSVTLEFRMSLGASSGIPGYTLPTANTELGYDIYIPEQKQNGYMVFVGFKVPLSTIFFMF